MTGALMGFSGLVTLSGLVGLLAELLAQLGGACEGLGVGLVGRQVTPQVQALLLPLGAMLYLDILEAKHEVKEQVEKVERLRRQVEQEKRKNDKP